MLLKLVSILLCLGVTLVEPLPNILEEVLNLRFRYGRNIRVLHACNTDHAVNDGDKLLIESLNFGTDTPYPENFSCGWTFRGTCKMTLNCNRFWMTDLSCGDKFSVTSQDGSFYDPPNELKCSTTKFCGHRGPQNYSLSNFMHIQFSTDRFKNLPGSGFQCEVSCKSEDTFLIEDNSLLNQEVNLKSGDTKCACGIPGAPKKIINGQNAQMAQYPWMVALVMKGSQTPFCGGSLINNKYVLTAAHCVEKSSKVKEMELVFNEYDISTRDEIHTIRFGAKRIIKHPGYNYYKNNDVALIEIEGNVTLGQDHDDVKIWNVCLPPEEVASDFAGSTVKAIGWGRTSNGGSLANILQETELEVITNEDCDPHHAVVSKQMMCAVGKDTDTCQGDSGGPIMISDSMKSEPVFIQVGITSSGSSRGCAKNIPGIYTRITETLRWIRDNSADGVGCTGNSKAFTEKLRMPLDRFSQGGLSFDKTNSVKTLL